MNSSVHKAIKCYKSVGKNFHDILFEYARQDYVVITPDAMILARLHPTYWHIEFAVGIGFLSSFLNLMPKDSYRPLVGWAREMKGKPYRYYKTETLRRLL